MPVPIRHGALVAAAVLAAFGASLAAGFHFDDFALFGDPYVTSPSGWWEVWRPEQTRPLTYFTFWLNYALGADAPAGYHAVNLLLHLVNSLLLYAALARLAPGRPALIAAVLFAVHPIQAEPVIYVYARATLLMTLFCLAGLHLWLRGRRWWAAAGFALALLAKEECAAFPVVLVLLHLSTPRSRREIAPIAVMFGLALAAGLRVIHVLSLTPESGAGTGAAYTVGEYLAAQGPVIARYLRLLVFPYGSTVDPEIQVPPVWQAAVAWGLILAVAALAARRRRELAWGFWALAGLVLLLPSSSVFPADDLAADRRMYLPLAFLAVVAGLASQRLHRGVLGAAMVALVMLSVARAQVWRDERSLWEEAVERSPGKARPKIRLSRVVEFERAIELLGQAQTIAPEDPRIASELGRRLLEAGDPGRSLGEFGRALALDPRNPLAFNNRGVVLLALGQREAARNDFESALRLNPCLFDARFNLRRMGVVTAAPADCRYTPDQRRALGLSR